MSEIETIREQLAEAERRLADLAAQAEAASDRGGRGPSPRDLADAEWLLDHQRRRLDLARGAMPTSLILALRRVR